MDHYPYIRLQIDGEIYYDSFLILKDALVPQMPIDIALKEVNGLGPQGIRYAVVRLKKNKETEQILLTLLIKHGDKMRIVETVEHPHGQRILSINGIV